jgi:hypothetical protein
MRSFAVCLLLGIGCQHPTAGQTSASTSTSTPWQKPCSDLSAVDPQFPVAEGLPGVPILPALTGVQQCVEGNRVSIVFQPVAGAKDYRVFPLPAAADVAVDLTGLVTVKNAIYRCAGDRFAVRSVLDGIPGAVNGWTTTLINGNIEGFTRTSVDATLGYVFAEAGVGRVPVYALGDPSVSADNQCGGEIWGASRVKKYTTSDAERAQLLAARWRDDGIAFYAAASGDVTVRTAVRGNSTLYFTGAEDAARSSLNPLVAFTALSAPAPGGVPLMRVFYSGGCGNSHDELVAGAGWFERISKQGNQPVFEVQWPGLTGDTKLVVEALDSGCPFQGVLSPGHLAAAGNAPPFVTLADVRASSATGEVYVNGQHAATNRPKAIARSYVRVQPAAAAMDWTAQLSPDLVFTETRHDNHGYWDVYMTAPGWDVQYYAVEPTVFTVGVVQGELWTAYADWGSDVNGKFRATPRQRATMSATSFVHATMTVDLWSTLRRYPQILISDVAPPVQENLASGNTLILQTRGTWPFALELQQCSRRTWDVNNQCPIFRLDLKPFTDPSYPPHPMVGELAAPMQLKRVDLYASTTRAYVFLDGKPYGCANLTGAPAPGPATVTFGDVLYHSGVDELVIPPTSNYPFLRDHQLTSTVRHFDNLGFSSGVAAPAWDTSRLPCTSTVDL